MKNLILITTLIALTMILVPSESALADGVVACSTSDNGFLFHHDFQTDEFVVSDPIDFLPEGNYPYDATMNHAWTEVWIPGASGDGVIVIDPWTGAITQRISVGDYPVSVAFNSDDSLALVSCRSDGGIYVIDTGSYEVISILPDFTDYIGPGNIAFDPVSQNFYVVEWYGNDIYEISADGSSVLRSANVGDSLWQLVVSADGDVIYVTDRGSDMVRVLDRATFNQIRTVPVGDDPWGIDLFDNFLVVCCEDSGDVYVVNTDDWTTRHIPLPADADPRDVDISMPIPTNLPDRDPNLEGAYVVGGRVGTTSPVYVIEIESGEVIHSFTVAGTNTNAIAVAPQNWNGGWDDVADQMPSPRLEMALYPNPFNPTTRVKFTIDQGGEANLAVYDVTGQEIRRLNSGFLPQGSHEVVWNGRNEAGEPMASGMYVVRLLVDGQSICRKAVLLK